LEIPVRTVAGLGYLDRLGESELQSCVGQVRAVAADVLGAQPDIWHIHNHSLGKGPALPRLVAELAAEKIPMVLQLHDFAEDGRPLNYQRISGWPDAAGAAVVQTMYPRNANIGYAVLTGRDEKLLRAAGIRNLFHLPNAVTMGEVRWVSAHERENRWLYPTRAIRRKNVGEFVLLAALAEGDERFAVTRAPLNPEQIRHYAPWVRFVQELELPVDFAWGDDRALPLAEMMATSRGVVTTSVAEGFGLAFLEPWLTGAALFGRDLPEITSDFKAEGIGLDPLYLRFEVPVKWVEEELRTVLRRELTAFYHAYGKVVDEQMQQRIWQACVRDGRVDFGCLNETMQRRVIRRILDEPGCGAELFPGRDWHERTVSREAVLANAQRVQSAYGTALYAQRLERMYEQLASAVASVPTYLSMDHVLDQFLRPERFRLLRS
jgi:hypothetical protein